MYNLYGLTTRVFILLILASLIRLFIISTLTSVIAFHDDEKNASALLVIISFMTLWTYVHVVNDNSLIEVHNQQAKTGYVMSSSGYLE